MTRLLLALGVASFISSAALAADIPVKARPLPPVSWTGFYVNGGIGAGMWTADTTTVSPVTGTCILCVPQTQGGKGWFGTIGAGYDHQFNSYLVGGVFADFDFSNIKGTIQDQGPFFAGSIRESRAWSAGSRVGLLVTPQTFSYVNAGYTQAHFSGASMVTTFNGTPTGFSTPSFDQSGWFIGTGLETPFSMFGPGWFWRSEYRYSYFGNKTLADTFTGGAPAASSITFKPTVQTARTELVYKFNWAGSRPAPVDVGWASGAPSAGAARWSGVYLSGGIGYGMWNADTTTVSAATGACVLCVVQRQGGKGWLGTVGAGYDRQFAGPVVAGVFANADMSSIKGTIQDQGPFFAGSIKEAWSWAAGSRVGWLLTPATLTYVNGGYTQTHFNSASMVTTFAGVQSGFSTPAFDKGGWFLGGGVERSLALFGLGPGWSWRSEYRYASFGRTTLTDTNAAGVSFNSITFKPTVQTIRSELVYRFNAPG